jgi:hypothetical protein
MSKAEGKLCKKESRASLGPGDIPDAWQGQKLRAEAAQNGTLPGLLFSAGKKRPRYEANPR